MIPYHELHTEITKDFRWPFWYLFRSLIWLSCFLSNLSLNFKFTVSFNSLLTIGLAVIEKHFYH